jgi:cholesterol transport system auxiliary component
MRIPVAVMLCGAVLAGCSGLRSSRPAEQVYVLHASPAAAAPAQAIPGVLRVPRPEVHPGLDTSRIALTRADNEMDYFADSRWGESLPKVLAAFAVESVSGSGQFETVVGAEAAAVQGDFDLLLTVRRFEADYADGRRRWRARHSTACCWVAPRAACWGAATPRPKSPSARIGWA